jgi:hypothetical protein
MPHPRAEKQVQNWKGIEREEGRCDKPANHDTEGPLTSGESVYAGDVAWTVSLFWE